MATDDRIRGRLVQYEEPTWEPLLNLLGAELVGDFMWMHEVALDTGDRVHAYKHIDTRRCIHLSDTGKTYAYLNRKRYTPRDAEATAALAEPARRPFGACRGCRPGLA
jgi:hypothetical protein